MADYINQDSTGVIIPDTSTTLAEVQAEWQTVFGTDLVVTPDTPQGVMIVAETSARNNVLNNNAALANQLNPNISGGVFLDAVAALFDLSREAATSSTVSGVTLTGSPGTLIPAGIRAANTNNDLFASIITVTLDSTGVAITDFRAVNTGPVVCAPHALTTVVDTVLGWETVDNVNAASLGTSQESDTAFRNRRNLTLGKQGISSVTGQISDVLDITGVRSMTFQENIANSTLTLNGIVMVAHSVWACVDGGADSDIAQGLLANKTVGGGWNGAVNVAVIEANSGQTYHVLFDRPVPVPILIRVTIRRGADLTDPTLTIIQDILNYAAGNIPNVPGFVVGAQASPFEIAAAVNYYNPALFVAKVEIAVSPSGTYQTTELPIAINQIATVLQTAILVVFV